MALTDVALRAAKPRDKAYKLTDAGGLYLLVQPSGSRLWQVKYRFAGKQKTYSAGPYPRVSLAEARKKRDAVKDVLARGDDPMVAKRQARASKVEQTRNTFSAVYEEWLAKIEKEGRASATLDKNRWLLRDLAGPHLDHRPMADITALELLDVLRKVEGRGKFETANRLRSICGTVFRYAVATGRAERDVAADLVGALVTNRSKPRAALTEPDGIGRLLRRIDSYEGRGVTRFALQLAPLVFLRPLELRSGEWSEIDEGDALWRVPAHKTKMRREHLVPLSRQALALLRGLRPLTGHTPLLFPATGAPVRPMSENTLRQAILKMGYTKEQMSAHGFRRTASTRLNELGFNPDWIERQLAHADRDAIRGTYNAAEWLEPRRGMMQEWADYLDRLRAGSDDIDDLIG